MKNSLFCFLEESAERKLWVSVWASLEGGVSWSMVWGVVNENAECEDVVLDVESRLGIDVHGVDAAIAKPQMQELQQYTRHETRNKTEVHEVKRKIAKAKRFEEDRALRLTYCTLAVSYVPHMLRLALEASGASHATKPWL
jgi:hypothetical protein